MDKTTETENIAVFCDFENVALGVKEARYDAFDIAKVLERLLLKGSIVVKKAYCDWERYKDFKAAMHEARDADGVSGTDDTPCCHPSHCPPPSSAC